MLNEEKVYQQYTQLQQEIADAAKESTEVPESLFKQIFVDYLNDLSVITFNDCIFTSFNRLHQGIRLDGYTILEESRSLTLVVSDYNASDTPIQLKKADVQKLFKGALKFLKLCLTTDKLNQLEETSDGYKAYNDILQQSHLIETVNIQLITNNLVKDDSIPENIEDDETLHRLIQFDAWDIERLYKRLNENNSESKIVIQLKKDYNTLLPLMRVPNDNPIYDCYIGYIPGKLLAQIYGAANENILQKNVRAFLSARGNINKGIKKTIETQPEMFMAYNNGISSVADSITLDEERSTSDIAYIDEINNWQIVNGGQTTASIYFTAVKNKTANVDLSKVTVPIKLSVIKQTESSDDLITKISRYANSQNKINDSDFSANDYFHTELEKLSRTIAIPNSQGKSATFWFYERARGQYEVEKTKHEANRSGTEWKKMFPKSHLIRKTHVAKCLMSFYGYPFIVSKGSETNFVVFSRDVKDKLTLSPEFYKRVIALVILFATCDEIVKQKGLDFKANINSYTLAIIGKFYKDAINLDDIWEKQAVSTQNLFLLEKLTNCISEGFQSYLQDNPTVNMTQQFKKNDFWFWLLKYYENHFEQ